MPNQRGRPRGRMMGHLVATIPLHILKALQDMRLKQGFPVSVIVTKALESFLKIPTPSIDTTAIQF